MRFVKVTTIFLWVWLLAACAGLTRDDTDQWLAGKNQSSTINMTGEWDSGGVWSGGWGGGRFMQEGRRFTGTLGLYYAEGVVSGETIYLVLYSGNSIYYTAMLNKTESGSYMGKAVYVTLADDVKAKSAQSYLISLKRVTR